MENAYPSLRNYWIALKGLWIKPGNELRKRNEIVEVLSDTDEELPSQEFPIIVDSYDDDDSNGFVRPVIRIEEDLTGRVQISSDETELPEKIDIVWNNKMLRTAGLCTTRNNWYMKGHYAKVQIALKVYDSTGDGRSNGSFPVVLFPQAQCLMRVGRYTKSLDNNGFICAKCKATLVLLPSYHKDGTLIVPHVRPFAKYVKENYRLI
ncbi:Acidic Repeat-Containing Protein [Manis pentadactyla]|nr:Acidic Repeat-Containing Protein [Manis pentadactyla]